MGKRSLIVIMLALCAFFMVISFSWYIGLQQAYALQKESLQTFIGFIHLPKNQLNHEQQVELAQQNNIQLYQIFRNQDELISTTPKTNKLEKSLILQALKQEDGFTPSHDGDDIFYKHEIDENSIHLASISLANIRTQYIQYTQYKILILMLAISAFFIILLAWQYRNKSQQHIKRLNQDHDKSQMGIYLKLDTSFRIIEYNDSFKHTFPHTLKQRFSQIVKADEQEKTEQYLSQVISSEALVDFECTLMQPAVQSESQANINENMDEDDESRWAIKAKPVRENGSTFIIISADDISKRHHMEIELRHERNRMHTYLNTMHTLLVISDRQGRIIEANQQFITLVGSDEKKVLGKPINNFCPKRSHHQIYNYLRNISPKSNTTVSAEFPLVAKTGKEYSIDWRITSVPNTTGNEEILLTGLDITESVANNQALKSANIQIREALRSAEDANQSKSVFLANMSHEIRTPMNGVLGMLNLLSSTNLNNKQRHQVRLARSSGEALLTLINDILDFSKIEAGKLEMESIDFDLRLLLGELAEGMALQAQSKGLEIVLDLARIEQSRVLGDPTRIRQLFVNLISNALKFTSEGEVVIRAALYAGDVGEMILEASVEDTGMGIPSAQIGHLFDSFSQVDASTTRKFGGTGLGLAIVKKLCHLMGGDISVTSEPAKGSCFAFNLSLGLSEKAGMVRPVVDLHGVRILVVDDNATNREVLEQQLSLWGAYVTEADSGDAALRIINEQAEEPFPVAIIDMQMPNMDGAELGRTIRADVRFQSTALIMMTSMSEPGDAQFFAQMGFAAYFPKPTTTSDLFDALAVVLGGGEALQAASPLVTPNYLRSLDAPSEDGSQPLSLPNSGFRLLLVEDNVINQHVAQGLLEDMGYCADIAADGAVAIEMLQAAPADAPYQLVFMDCQMPVIDGYEATAKIRAGDAGVRYRDIPIVAMTANAMAGDRVKCLEAGMDDYIAKPIDPDLLEGILTQYQGLSAAKLSAATSSAPTPEGQGAGRGEQTTRPESHGEADQEHPVWDREGLLRRVRGNESLMLTLLQQFILDMPQQVEQLEQAVADEDLPQVSSLAHTIKGIAGNLSGQRLQHLAAAMEQSVSQGESEDLQRQWTNFAEQYRQLYLNLEEYTQVQASGPVAAPAQSETQGERVLLIEQLRAKLEQGSYVDAGDLQPFEAHCQQGPEQALLTALIQQLSQFDMPAALVSLNQLAAVLISEE